MNTPNSLIEQLKSNWVIIVCVAGIISTWTLFSARLSSAENDIDNLSEVVSQINQINIDIAVIKQQLAEAGKKDAITSGKIDASNGKLDYIINTVSSTQKR